MRRSAHVKYIEPGEKVENQPSKEIIKNYGRSAKLLLAPRDIPDIHFPVAEREDKDDSPEKTGVIELMNVNIKDCVTVPRKSDFREHSRNSLESVADNKSAETKRRTFSRDMHLQHSECREHSQNSRIQETVGVAVIVSSEDTKCSAVDSDFPEHSQNSLSTSYRETESEEANVSLGDRNGPCSMMISEFRELSPNSQVLEETTEGSPQCTKPVCVGEPSEYSRDSLGVGNNVSVPSFSWFKSMSQIVGLTATWHDKVEGNPMGANTAGNAKINVSPVHTEFNFFL